MLELVLVLNLVAAEPPMMEARYTSQPPRIDGELDEVWAEGDSAKGFIQRWPLEGAPASESTTVYLLYDDENLYIAFKCYDSEPDKILLRTVPRDNYSGDHVWVFLDTFDDKRNAYEFCVNAKGVQFDARVSEDGRIIDPSWDGVWYSAARVTEFGYSVELQIPFKTIRFSNDTHEWGINFFRSIARKHEDASWAGQRRSGHMRVSRSGRLKGILPRSRGLHLEVYPVGLGRYEGPEPESIAPDMGVDLNWHLTSASRLQFTINPDFAQIEADPYKLNLSKYEVWLSERRPFFTEAAEIFKFSGIEWSIGDPITLFYSRRVGRPLPDGQVVPIRGGGKFTTQVGRAELGVLAALTPEVEYEWDGDTLSEPRSLYTVARAKQGILENSELGFLYAGRDGPDGFNRGVGLDGVLRLDPLQVMAQGALTQRKGYPNGYAYQGAFYYPGRNLFFGAGFDHTDEDYRISEIGYESWKGTKYELGGGPIIYDKGILRSLSSGIGFGQGREAGESIWTSSAFAWLNPWLKNNWGCSFNFQSTRDYEQDSLYTSQGYELWFWTDESKPFSFYSGGWLTTLEYNYSRGYFAPSGGGFLELNFKPLPGISSSLSLTDYIEWRPDRTIEAHTWVISPRIHYSLTRDLHLQLYGERVIRELSPGEPDRYIINCLLSYNFRPKSWLYLALNETLDSSSGRLRPYERVVVLKIRWLLFL